MRKPNSNPTYIKNRILVAIYVFRSLPAYYFEDIERTEGEEKKIQFLINNLIQGGYIKKKPSLRKRIQFLLLTKKGHDFVTTNVLENSKTPFYQYRTDRLARFSDTDHRYMNFVYIWVWIANNTALLSQGIRIYEDSNRNNCRLPFAYAGETIVLYPDVLILVPDEKKGSEFFKATIVETDTGTETSGTLFRKIVEYAAFASKGMGQGFITEAELIFTLHSQARSTRVLPNLVQQAKTYNSTLKVKDVKAGELLHAFGATGMKLSFSVVSTLHITDWCCYTLLPYDFRKELLEHNPSWHYLL